MKRKILYTVLLFFALASSTVIQEIDFREKVKIAGELVGLEFTDSEIELMESGVKTNIETYKKNRKFNLSNDLAPPLIFDPLPYGFATVHNKDGMVLSDYHQTSMPEDEDELAFLSIGQLGHLLRTGQITSVALTRFYLDRLQKYDPRLHCVISLMEDRAIRQAQLMDQELAAGKDRGPLHGIPCGIKDLLSTADYKTTWGARPYKDQMIPYDAAVVSRLEDAGAVITAKLSLGALAWGDVWFGEKTRNPWDPETGSSGSSAGSASAVSAGLLPFAIGTETLGSIVSPATVCGVTGLRPTFGRVSRYGAMALSWTMDKIGPICRNAEDCIMVLSAIEGKDDRDPYSSEQPLYYDANMDLSGLKIGFIKADFARDYPFQANDSLILDKLKAMGLDLIPVELPESPDIGFILEAEAAAAFDELTTSGLDDSLVRQIENAWPNVFRQARLIPAVEYIKANRIRSLLIRDMEELMQEVDVIIHPSWASRALRITNLTGHPSLVIPSGFREGKPTSITITGKLFDEGTLVRLGSAIQMVTDHHLKHPELSY